MNNNAIITLYPFMGNGRPHKNIHIIVIRRKDNAEYIWDFFFLPRVISLYVQFEFKNWRLMWANVIV